jgi:hypothetical protein
MVGVMDVVGKACWLRVPIQKRMVRMELVISRHESQESAAAVAAAMTIPWE